MFLVGVFTGEVGALASVEWLPWLLVGLPAGAWVDRSRKRPLLIACDLARVVLLGSVPVAAALGVLTLGQLLAVAFLTGLCTVFFQVVSADRLTLASLGTACRRQCRAVG